VHIKSPKRKVHHSDEVAAATALLNLNFAPPDVFERVRARPRRPEVPMSVESKRRILKLHKTGITQSDIAGDSEKSVFVQSDFGGFGQNARPGS
jgi:hypothetical protein